MQDLTAGSVSKHLLKTMSFMLVTMVFQTLYFLIDLYWVGRLGTAAVAGVGIAGNVTWLVLALTQMLGVGTTTVVSHAVGRKDQAEARLLFNQAQMLAMLTGGAFLVIGLLLAGPYVDAMSADPGTAQQARAYLLWFVPAMALQFALVAMGASLRAIGNFKASMLVGTGSIVINMVLAPFLIFGWGPFPAFGVAGAAIASLVGIIAALVWLVRYFAPLDAYLRFDKAHWRPHLDVWRRMLSIGLPAGFEFVMTTVYLLLVYSITKPFGAYAQAGFGIGMRVIQAGFMPVVALGMSVAPMAGQNFGARQRERVLATFKDAALMAAGVMLAFMIVCQIAPHALIDIFTDDPAVITMGEEYLRIISWNFVASGLIFVASSMFQAMGNTMPSLIASGTRIALIAAPAVILSARPDFQLEWIWYLSVASVFVQLGLAMVLLRREFRAKLAFAGNG